MQLESQRKRRRLENDDDAGDGAGCSSGDPLSALPDCLLHDILSRLKARQVVQTCVLSRRWSSLWRSVPCLDVDQDEFKPAAAAADDATSASTQECWGRFEKFTDHLLIRRNVGVALLDSFRLTVGDPRWRDQAARWIRHIVKYGAQDHHRHPHPSPAATTASWSLKTLHLSNVHVDDRLAKHIKARCPSLQDVQLKGCRCDMRQIASRSLRKLILKDCDCTRLSEITSPKLESLVICCGCVTGGGPLVVIAPALVYLAVSVAYCPGGVRLDEMPSLDHALVDLQHTTVTPLWQNVPGIDYCKLLDSVSSVEILELQGFRVAVECTVFPQFKNLKTLAVSGCKRSSSFEMLLRHFLRSSPNLNLLAVHYCVDCPHREEIAVEYRVTEIRYKEGEYLLHQVMLLLSDRQDIFIELIKVGPMSLESVENFTWDGTTMSGDDCERGIAGVGLDGSEA